MTPSRQVPRVPMRYAPQSGRQRTSGASTGALRRPPAVGPSLRPPGRGNWIGSRVARRRGTTAAAGALGSPACARRARSTPRLRGRSRPHRASHTLPRSCLCQHQNSNASLAASVAPTPRPSPRPRRPPSLAPPCIGLPGGERRRPARTPRHLVPVVRTRSRSGSRGRTPSSRSPPGVPHEATGRQSVADLGVDLAGRPRRRPRSCPV